MIRAGVMDLAGNELQEDVEWSSRIWSLQPPDFDLEKHSGIGASRAIVEVGSPTATVATFVLHGECLDGFNFVIDHGKPAVVEHRLGEDLAPLAPEFFTFQEISEERLLFASIQELEAPFDFLILDAREPAEVLRLTLDVSVATAVNPVRMATGPSCPRRILPEFTVEGVAVAPAEFIDGEVVVTGKWNRRSRKREGSRTSGEAARGASVG